MLGPSRHRKCGAMKPLIGCVAGAAVLLMLAGCSFEINPPAPVATVTVGASAQPSTSAASEPAATAPQSSPEAGCVTSGIHLPSFVSGEACRRVEMAPYARKEFKTPSGNISCAMERDSVDCVARETRLTADTYQPEGDGYCVGYRLNDEVALNCGSFPIDIRGVEVQYGQAVNVGQFRCTVEEVGVTCWSGLTGHGFFLSKGRYASW